MVVIRRTEEALARAHAAGLVHGACHTYVGQEAIAVGVCAHLRPDDVVFSTHRGHGHALAKGVPPRELIAELFGRATGCSRGRGGSMHLFAPEVGLMGTSGIVGPVHPAGGRRRLQLQAAQDRPRERRLLRRRRRQQRRLPRGAEPGGIWELPVLFVCENNQYATEVPFADGRRQPGRRRPAAGLRHAGRRGRRQRRPGGPRGGRRGGRAGARAATGRRCSSAAPTAPAPTPRACATSATARGRRSTSWKAR